MTPAWVPISALVVSVLSLVYTGLSKRKDRANQVTADGQAAEQRRVEQREIEARFEREQQGLREQIDSLREMVEPLRDVAETLRLSRAQPEIA